MKINWGVRFKNKVWLASFLAAIVSFIYTILGMFDVYPALTQDVAVQVVNAVLFVLAAVGIIVDPTTAGVGDSERALGYIKPGVTDPDLEGKQE